MTEETRTIEIEVNAEQAECLFEACTTHIEQLEERGRHDSDEFVESLVLQGRMHLLKNKFDSNEEDDQ